MPFSCDSGMTSGARCWGCLTLTIVEGLSGFGSSGVSRFGRSTSSSFFPKRSTNSHLLDHLVGLTGDPLPARGLPDLVLPFVLPVVLLALHVGEGPLLVGRVSGLADRRHRRGGRVRIQRDDKERERREIRPGPADPRSQPTDSVGEPVVLDRHPP